ncbi:MAG: signal peptidase II [Deltaproteobacteria bacterium]|nr:signal peptidase II [Deltaproteobacteria bacterium]
MKFSLRSALAPLHIWTVVISVVLDQFSKWAVIQWIPLGTHIPLMPSLNLAHIKNRGAAFGMFHDMPNLFRAGFFGLVTIGCFYLLIYWLGTIPKQDRWQRFSLSLILGGAIGNVIDRVLFGHVTDFVDFYIGEWHFATFNIADSAITIGVTLMFISMIPWPIKLFKFRTKAK